MDFGAKLGHLIFVILTVCSLGLYLLWFQFTVTQERNRLLREVRDQGK